MSQVSNGTDMSFNCARQLTKMWKVLAASLRKKNMKKSKKLIKRMK